MRAGGATNALLALTVAAVSIVLQSGGQLAVFENLFADFRTHVLEREVSSDIVIVGIDARSIAELNKWPWARRTHSALLQQLRAAKPQRVFVDIDFSSQSEDEDDALLRTELANWPSGVIGLPVFFQPRSASDTTVVLTEPRAEFAQNVQLASVNQVLGSDGLVRQFRSAWGNGQASLPSAPMFIAAKQAPPAEQYAIDYAINPASFGYLSYVDVLKGDFDSRQLTGKIIIVGSMALELKDVVPVPVHQSLAGPVVLALSAQTLLQVIPKSLPYAASLSATLVWSLLCMAFFANRSWRGNLLGLTAGVATIAGLSVFAYATDRLVIDVVPLILVSFAGFLVVVLKSLDREAVRALLLALGLRKRDALMHSVVQSSSDGILCIDGQGRVQSANLAASALFECEHSDLVGRPISAYIQAFDAPAALATLLNKLSECEVRTSAGRQFPIELSLCRVEIGEEELYTLIARDISDRKAQERKLEYQARHDALTGLPNRAALNDHLDRALTHSDAQPVALLMLDLCRFKEVNDTLGHNVGDTVLREVANRFRANVGELGFLARIGGDEFTVVLGASMTDARIDAFAAQLAASMHVPIKASGIALDVGVSVGIAVYPLHANDAQSLLKHADVAMYAAKRRGTNFERYDPTHDEHTVRRLAMIGELRSAIESEELELHYQPQVNLHNNRVESAEALLRWRHPAMGAVSPAEFIAVAESTDLIQPLTQWTLHSALSQLQNWQRQGVDLRVAVNLSSRMLQDVTFPQQLRDLLIAAAVLPSRLELEITESAMMLDPARALRVVNEIHAMGVIVSVDDYGTGFSSLGYLRDLPLHALKLDKSFVMQANERADDRIIVESTVQLGHALKLQVVAEGVESEWHARFLTAMGYDFAQGFHFARAMPAANFFAWMRNFNATTDSSSALTPPDSLSDGRRAQT